MFGLYRKTEEMTDGRSVYTQEHDVKYGENPYKISSYQGAWRITDDDTVYLRAVKPSENATSVKWKYKLENGKWRDDPTLTVTDLNEKPSCECSVTINLSESIARDIREPNVVGLYKSDGSYYLGRPVLQHSGGSFTLSVNLSWGPWCWMVSSGIEGDGYLISGSAPSLCPADPKAARNELQRQTHWRYEKKQSYVESSGIIVKCEKHKNHSILNI